MFGTLWVWREQNGQNETGQNKTGLCKPGLYKPGQNKTGLYKTVGCPKRPGRYDQSNGYDLQFEAGAGRF